MTKIFAALACLIWPLSLFAATPNVQVVVTNFCGGCDGANRFVQMTANTVQGPMDPAKLRGNTDASGQITFTNVPAGFYTLTIYGVNVEGRLIHVPDTSGTVQAATGSVLISSPSGPQALKAVAAGTNGITATTNVQGVVTVSHSGTFDGRVTAGAFAGDGSGLTGVSSGVSVKAGTNVLMTTNSALVTVNGLTDTNVVKILGTNIVAQNASPRVWTNGPPGDVKLTTYTTHDTVLVGSNAPLVYHANSILTLIHDQAIGESDNPRLLLESYGDLVANGMGDSQVKAFHDFDCSSSSNAPFVGYQLGYTDTNGASEYFDFFADGDVFSQFLFSTSIGSPLDSNPMVISPNFTGTGITPATAYKFGTSKTVTAGHIVDFLNAGTSKFAISNDAVLYWGADATVGYRPPTTNALPGQVPVMNGATPQQILYASFYNGNTNIGNLATTLVIAIGGHTMPNTNYTPSVSFMGSALAAAVTPTYSARTPTNFTLNLSAGISGGDNLSWSVISNP